MADDPGSILESDVARMKMRSIAIREWSLHSCIESGRPPQESDGTPKTRHDNGDSNHCRNFVMPKAYYSAVLNQPVDHVWKLVRDFNDYPKYIEGVSESRIEDGKRGDEVGAVRRFCYGGSWIRQRLSAHSDAGRSFSYTGMDPFPYPIRGEGSPADINYSGTLRLAPVVDGNRTFVEWFVEFDGRVEDAEPWRALLMALIPQWVGSLGRAAEAR